MQRTIMIALLITLTVTEGCVRFMPKREIRDVSHYCGPGKYIVLLPYSQQQLVRVAPSARRVGNMTGDDWTAIVALIGRLPGLSAEERTVHWVWCEGSPATVIRVALGVWMDYPEVTFTRTGGRWQLSSIAAVIVD